MATGGVLDEVEVGDKYKGSVVTMMDIEVVDGPKKYHVKRQISLENGAVMSDEYWKDKVVNGKKPVSGRVTKPVKKAKDPDQKAKARAKAKALMAQRGK
eukprot:CAMPEP_0117001976 /NCGR_PEP_ID=MMETSP0472-20121206/3798_1 /TAXON_ID=693140 ORGANISM="Tiarina fusus, Strain LIS" /NCGR_SAMPLE_ID=MMETSP0472 /ASSEMBLY_ACC=CAM_ASM_000603 /LENGTH=98 /DNA_ID=CAMNT_0004702167 /DNA_START=163 /DNA_END=462 /DNA_ORIENTATION=-